MYSVLSPSACRSVTAGDAGALVTLANLARASARAITMGNCDGRCASAAVLSFPLRSFFRRSRPALAWQSEQIGRLNLSELQRRVSAGFCYNGAISPLSRAIINPRIRSRFATSNQKFARVVRKSVWGTSLYERTNERTHSVTRRCAHNRPRLTFYVCS